jgi:hypothetical protein
LGAEFIVHTKNSSYHATQVVLAVPARPAESILRSSGYTTSASLLKHVKGQPFVRAYVRFTGPANYIEKNVPTLLVCDGPFRKIIRMSKSKRVYMIAYCDNQHTRFWKTLLGLPKKTAHARVCTALSDMFDAPFALDDMIIYYHPVGTHYYAPLPRPSTTRTDFITDLVHADRGLTLVGEAVSINQGWTEGALESVKMFI